MSNKIYKKYPLTEDPLFLKDVVDKEQFMHAASRPVRAYDLNLGDQRANTDFSGYKTDGVVISNPVDVSKDIASGTGSFLGDYSIFRRWGREFNYGGVVKVHKSTGSYIVLLARLLVNDEDRIAKDYDYSGDSKKEALSWGKDGSYGVEYALLLTDETSSGWVDNTDNWTPIYETRLQLYKGSGASLVVTGVANEVLDINGNRVVRYSRLKKGSVYVPMSRGDGHTLSTDILGYDSSDVVEWVYIPNGSGEVCRAIDFDFRKLILDGVYGELGYGKDESAGSYFKASTVRTQEVVSTDSSGAEVSLRFSKVGNLAEITLGGINDSGYSRKLVSSYKQSGLGKSLNSVKFINVLNVSTNSSSVITSREEDTIDLSKYVKEFGLNNIDNTLNVNKGGTGKASITAGALIYGDGTKVVKEIAKGSNNTLLTVNDAGEYVWNGVYPLGEVVSGDILYAKEDNKFDKFNISGSGEFVFSRTSGGVITAKNATLLSINGFTNTLNVNKGGTGKTTLTAGNILIGNGTSAIDSITKGTTNKNKILTINNSNVYEWSDIYPLVDIVIGDMLYASGAGKFSRVNIGSIDLNDFGTNKQLGVSKGGTGKTTLTAGNILIGNGTNSINEIVKGTTNKNKILTIDNDNVYKWSDVYPLVSLSQGDMLYYNGTKFSKISIGSKGNYILNRDINGVITAADASTLDISDFAATLTVDKGGTGRNELVKDAILLGNVEDEVGYIEKGTTNKILTINNSNVYEWSSLYPLTGLSKGNMLYYDGTKFTNFSIGSAGSYILKRTGDVISVVKIGDIDLNDFGTNKQLGVAKGGTGKNTLKSGALIYGDGINAVKEVDKGSNNTLLTVKSDGTYGWVDTYPLSSIVSGDILYAKEANKFDKFNIGEAGEFVFSRASGGVITAKKVTELSINGFTNTLNVAKGGTGKTTLTAGALIYGNGTGVVNELEMGDIGDTLTIQTVGVNKSYVWSSVYPLSGIDKGDMLYATGANKFGKFSLGSGAGDYIISRSSENVISAKSIGSIDLNDFGTNKQLGVSKGGTGKASITAGALIYGDGTKVVKEIAKGSNNTLLTVKSDGTYGWVDTYPLSSIDKGDMLYATGANKFGKFSLGTGEGDYIISRSSENVISSKSLGDAIDGVNVLRYRESGGKKNVGVDSSTEYVFNEGIMIGIHKLVANEYGVYVA